MPQDSNWSERLDALETRIAYQDRTIEELNAIVTEQWKLIEALTRKLLRVEDRLAETENGGPLAPNDGPPLHW